MQGLDDGSRVLLSQQPACLGLEFARLALDLVELGDQRHRLAGNLAGVERMRLEQLPAGVGHAKRGRDALPVQRVIARIVVGHERAAEAVQHASRILAPAAE